MPCDVMLGRDAHRCLHAAAKCTLYLKDAGPPMQNLGYFRDAAELSLIVYVRMHDLVGSGVVWLEK